jgi:hypothetical protein
VQPLIEALSLNFYFNCQSDFLETHFNEPYEAEISIDVFNQIVNLFTLQVSF